MIAEADCYHCGLPVPQGTRFAVNIVGQSRTMCCAGCQAVAESIVENGLEAYYTYRTELPKTAETLVPDALKDLERYNHPEVQKSFVFFDKNQDNNQIKQASLILEGITCAACIWLNERHIKQIQGVVSVSVNYASHRARVAWDDNQVHLSTILAEILKLGYHAHPFSAQQQDNLRQKHRQSEFRRLAVAGLCAGQVMMIAVALYAGSAQGLEIATAQLLRWLSLVLSVPAMVYAAYPFYQGAWRSLKNLNVGMDVPIVIGLLTGFAGSIYATVQGQGGHVYFDTLTMLIFFLLATRFLERNARERSVEAAENLLRLVPAMATKIAPDQQPNWVPLAEIAIGDTLLVKPGETIATDGVVLTGESSADESLLTGESQPLTKNVGDRVYAGSVNYQSPLTIRVTEIGENTMLAGISRLLDRAQAEKPKLAMVADRVASYFTAVLLLIVALVALFWWWHAPERVLEIVLSVLVVSCPCALSLAAPAAFAAASAHLVKRGVLLTRGHALETLANITHVVFDKTGTLTLGRPQLVSVHPYAHLSGEDCLILAASLEQFSEHPIAKAIIDAAKGHTLLLVEHAKNLPGQGVAGEVAGQAIRIGSQVIRIEQAANLAKIKEQGTTQGETIVWLCDAERDLAAFVLKDSLRPQAESLIKKLADKALHTSILSGDATTAVQHVAQQLGIQDWQAGLSPAQKLLQIQSMQAKGAVVAMVGDGINDAPVLAGAQVSIAMGSGTQMARTSGDAVLLTENLNEIDHAITTSRLGISIIRQNFIWALVYNAVALPFAASGALSPLMAAIGMSVSSLVVVLNALRLV